MLQSQRQTSTIHYQQRDSQSPNNQPANKKKHIKKDNGNKLTKEQKLRLQKQKNRQAAQRSRDQHRQYVSNLQREVKQLKQQLELNRHFCQKCKKTLTSQDMFEDEPLSHHIPIQNQPFSNNSQQLANEKVSPILNVENQPDYLLRIGNVDDEFSYLKMILFVSMIAIAVFIFPASKQEDHSRNLLQRFTPPTSKPIISDDFIISSQNPHDQSFIDINNSLVVRNSILNQQCLNSLIQERSNSLANLRTSHPSLGQINQGILLCSFEQQKQESWSNTGQKSTFLRLFLLGTQIKQMITTQSSIKNFIQSNIQLNGIYRIAAEIKQVELISHHNCLL